MDTKQKIDPNRSLTGWSDKIDTHLLYTTAEGEELQIYLGFTEKQFKDLKKCGYFERSGMGDYKEVVFPAFAQLVRNIDTGYDFILAEMNGDLPRPRKGTPRKVRFSHLHGK